MSDLARDTYGFGGYFTSDCDAVYEIPAGHHWQPRMAPAPLDQYGRTAYAISAGEDLDCNWGYHDQYSYGNTVPAALAQHIRTQTDTFNIGDVDTSLTRLFTASIATGEFDAESRVPWVRAARKLGGTTWVSSPSNDAITETPKRLAQARRSARESLVLLQNRKGCGICVAECPSGGDPDVPRGDLTAASRVTCIPRVEPWAAPRSHRERPTPSGWTAIQACITTLSALVSAARPKVS